MIPSLAAIESEQGGSGSRDTPIIVGSVVGGAAGLALIIGGAFILYRRRKKQHKRMPLRRHSSFLNDDTMHEFYQDPYRQSREFEERFQQPGGFPGTGEEDLDGFSYSKPSSRSSWLSSLLRRSR